jgi:hypothetical protein
MIRRTPASSCPIKGPRALYNPSLGIDAGDPRNADTNRGKVPLREGLRGYYERTTRLNRLSYHQVQDFCIRVTEPGSEAWMAAYFHTFFVAGNVQPSVAVRSLLRPCV